MKAKLVYFDQHVHLKNSTNTPQVSVRNCDGGHICHPPKECCKQGCCYTPGILVDRHSPLPTTDMLSPIFIGHWYFWAAITATLAGILCACSLWRRHNSSHNGGGTTGVGLCCGVGAPSMNERASELDSNGSCYVPPQYSRCSSIHQAPPPYSEVTSKPDLYPVVISYNGDAVVKANSTSTGYLMVQYFRNFIVRPVGTLSATSTIDSLSSSFICNATNEANTIIPPPYSCTGSLEELNSPSNNNSEEVTVSSPPRRTSSNLSSHIPVTSSSPTEATSSTTGSVVSEQKTKIAVAVSTPITHPQPPATNRRKLNLPNTKNLSIDSESDEHNFSDLLNLSVCVPSSVIHLSSGTQSNPQMDMIQSYSVTNSMTSSDVSSLANLGTPDSPPQATSPTLEMRELLDKIQQLPQHKSPVPPTPPAAPVAPPSRAKQYFNRAKVAKTLYMPLHDTGVKKSTWFSRSAPNTPSSAFVPNFPLQKRNSGSSSKGKLYDGSPLLKEHDESDDEQQPPQTQVGS